MAAEAQWLSIVADRLGAPHALFGEDGQCHWRAEPELWGRTRTARALLRERRAWSDAEGADETPSCALRFPGQWEDAESGLHYNLNRYYDPDTGQYLSPDPIGVDGGLQTHAYVHDPLRWMDPEGVAECTASSRDIITRGPNGEITSVKGTIHPSDIGTGTHTNSSSRAWVRQLGKATDGAGHTRPKNAGGRGGKNTSGHRIRMSIGAALRNLKSRLRIMLIVHSNQSILSGILNVGMVERGRLA